MAAPSLRSIGTAASGLGDIVPGLPAGYQADDIFLLAVETADQAVSVPSGWNIVTGSPQSLTGQTRLSVFWRRATASESAPTVTDPGDHAYAVIFAFSGCKTSGDPWNTSAGNSASGLTVNFPTVTTTVDDCLIVNIGTDPADSAIARVDSWANADLVSITEQFDAGATAGNGGGLFAATGVKSTAGAVSSTSASDVFNSVGYAMMTVALSPPTNQDVTKSTSGSVAFSGAATNKKVAVKTASGSVALSGSATQYRTRVPTISGSLDFSGALTKAVSRPASGSITFGGTAVADFAGANQATKTASGSLALSGTAVYEKRLSKSASGEISFEAFSALKSVNRQAYASGSLTFTGTADAALRTPFVAEGSIVIGGTVTFERTKSFIASGNLAFSSIAIITRNQGGSSVWNSESASHSQSLSSGASVWESSRASGGTAVDTPSVWG